MKSNNPRQSTKSRKLGQSIADPDVARWLVPLVVAVATCAAFFPALWNEFVDWDDTKTLVENTYYRGLGWDQLRWMFTTFHMGHYQPLSWITLGLDYLIWGTDPFGYHLTNLVLHAANGVLFYFLVRRLFSAALSLPRGEKELTLSLAAGLAALVFAVHPLRVESVAWATERRDVLSGFFFLASLYCYLRAQENPRNQYHRPWLGLALMAYTLSLLGKAAAITLPAVLLLIDIYPLRRLQGGFSAWFKPNVRNVFWEKLPFLLLAVLFALIAVFAQQNTGALRPVQQYFVSYRVFQAFYALYFYLWKSLLPIRLSPLYELPYDFDAWVPFFLLCGAAAVSITLLLYLLRRRWPALLACWAYYVIVLAPVSGVAQSGPQLAADRYSYLSCLSWAVLLGGAVFHLWKSVAKNSERRPVLFTTSAVAVLVVITLSIVTWKQTGVWRNTRTLWEHAVAVAPDSSVARYNLGLMFEHEGKLDVAVEYYRFALSINPAQADAHYNLARLLAKRGMQPEAIAHYRQASKIRPDDADTHNNLGLLLALQGDVEASLAEFRKAVQIDPNYGRAFFNMARVFARQGELGKAVQNYRQALKLNPDQAEILLGLGDALARQGQLEEATTHFMAAVKLNPDLADAHIALARSLAAQGKKDEAAKQYQEALQLLKSQRPNPPPNSAGSQYRIHPAN